MCRKLLPLLMVAAFPHLDAAELWTTYSPENLPPGKVLSLEQVAGIDPKALSENVYVWGAFIVTASSEDRAVLRSDPMTKVRLVVVYPEGYEVPKEGTKITRDEKKPFRVINLSKTGDGQINLAAREIIKSE